MDLAQQKMSEFANTLFEKLVFASKDSTDLNDTIDQYVQLFTDPEVKFGQLTQHTKSCDASSQPAHSTRITTFVFVFGNGFGTR